ncbi:protein MANNAN SYNTHESIS-RELATED 2-like [Rhodamnia argentea]|uniref:O-fucosyltransferase family protein n=1 Tax=Rhodamnia argentea TaxID=178133 RepID=A0A8B8PN01_9MYRT|nr:protein MANNAN SYNTHESIS-RELATED 2-like [Rhodamnia argentea]
MCSLVTGQQPSQGYITFSLTNGPEYHILQVAVAVLVARELGASLVLPDIRGSKPGDRRNFREIYDVEEFANRLNGVVKVARNQLALASSRKLAVVKVPYMVSKDYIRTHIKPFFKAEGSIRLETPLSSINMKKAEATKVLDPITCLTMFRTLRLQTKVRQLVDQMIGRLKTLGGESNGQFIAVDLRVEAAQSKSCQPSGSAEMKFCHHAQDVGEFLTKTGVSTETPIYVTQSRWHKNLKPLTDIFPRTFTKEFLMPPDKKDMFLSSASCELEKVIDFYLASESDVFIPASANWFYATVAGSRIASGRTRILVPTLTSSSSSSHISPYISERKHYAYSCFC